MIQNFTKDYWRLPITPYTRFFEKDIIEHFFSLGKEIPTLDIIDNNKTTWYIFDDNIRFQFWCSIGHLDVKIESGTITDLGSIPDIGELIISKDDEKSMIAFIIHDVLFQSKALGIGRDGFNRANLVMKELMRYFGVHPLKTEIVYQCVSSDTGWFIYQKREERDSEKYRFCTIGFIPTKKAP